MNTMGRGDVHKYVLYMCARRGGLQSLKSFYTCRGGCTHAKELYPPTSRRFKTADWSGPAGSYVTEVSTVDNACISVRCVTRKF